ncbi:MAG: FAD-binding protein [Myxococcota bacterium]
MTSSTASTIPPSPIASVMRRLVILSKSLIAPKRPEPSYPILPAISKAGESTVPGVYLVGEVSGVPLIKLGINSGHDLVDRLATELGQESHRETVADVLDILIVGAGAAGLGAASRAQELGLRAVTVEANHVAETVYTVTKGKILFAEPQAMSH